MHIHSNTNGYDSRKMLDAMGKADIYGGCVFSAPPKEHAIDFLGGGLNFEERLQSVMESVKGYEDRIFPVLWIHPYEENIIEKVGVAVPEIIYINSAFDEPSDEYITVAVFNSSNNVKEIAFSPADIGLSETAHQTENVWAGKESVLEEFRFILDSHESVLLKIKKVKRR